MNEQLIIQKFFLLPESLKQEVLHYITFLTSNFSNQESNREIESFKEKKPVFGSAKDKYILKPNFDDPIEDFNDYIS